MLNRNSLSWHLGSAASTDTRGNNIIAQSNFNGNQDFTDDYRPIATNGDFLYGFKSNATRSSDYINASVTQLFYTTNMMHDLLYTLGFNEVAGNFQETNRGKGGVEGDAVIVNSQDGQGLNNAFFLTPGVRCAKLTR
jgi:extracellular elastinolytic metalloproteinase